jgi:hypothetical protein
MVYRSALNRFLGWLNARPEWVGVDARGLLERQRAAVSNGEQYAILDLLQEWVSSSPKARKSKVSDYGAVSSFFLHNRCALPKDPSFRIRGGRVVLASKLTVANLVDMVKAATLRDRSLILVKWQGFLDNRGLEYVGAKLADEVTRQIRDGVNPIRLDLPSRKLNMKSWYTFIGRDAVNALKEYFEKERGWPRPGEPIWLTTRRQAITANGFEQTWMRLCRRVGFVPKRRGPLGSRYGYNAHETRDLAKSLLHTHALRDGFDMDCCEFWLGHTVDPLGYDKFFNDTEYVRKQYLIAEKYLNIISQSPIQVDRERKLEERIEVLRAEIQRMQERLESIR